MLRPSDVVGADWPEDIPEVIYVDDFGSAITGLRATRYPQNMALSVPGVSLLPAARTFSEVPVGRPFWYANSLGLIEIAVNQGRADHLLGLKIGDPVQLGAAT